MIPFLVHAWVFLWPILSTLGTVVAAVWAVVQAWPFIRRTFAVTDIVASLPEQLAELRASDQVKLAAIAEVKATLDSHIAATRLGTEEWNEMKDGLKTLLVNQEKVIHEVQHNGGTSIKDAVARIESAVTAGKEVP